MEKYGKRREFLYCHFKKQTRPFQYFKIALKHRVHFSTRNRPGLKPWI